MAAPQLVDFVPDMIDDDSVIPLASTLNQQNFFRLLKLLDDHYHNDVGLISDAVYDKLVDMYQSQFGPYREVGADPTGEMVPLPYYLGSLDKLKTEAEVDGWLKKRKRADGSMGPFIVEDKIDGMTLLLIWNKGVGKLYTRGGGVKGMDVSHLIPYMRLPAVQDYIAIRGEAVLTKAAFARIGAGFKNARNLAAGAVKAQKQFNPIIARELSFFAYRIVSENNTPLEDIIKLQQLGYLVPNPGTANEISRSFLESYLAQRKQDAPYEMDGLVIYDNVADAYPAADNPKHVVAFKVDAEAVMTTVTEVIWEASKDRYLKPVVHYQTVNMSGADLQRASGYNARFIVNNKIGPGATITLLRSGDVIPKIITVVSPSPSGPQYPDPQEHGEYTWNENGVEFVLKQDNDQVLTNKLKHFLDTLDIKNAGPARVRSLVAAGIKTIYQLLSATPAQLSQIAGIGPILANQFVNDLKERVTHVDLATIMDASGIFPRVGTKRFTVITDAYPKFLDYAYYDPKEIARAIRVLPGFNMLADEIAGKMSFFADWLKQHPMIVVGSQLAELETKLAKLSTAGPPASNNGPTMAGMTFVFSGFRDAELEKRITARGGKVTTSVSGKTTALIMRDTSDRKGKALEAEQKGVPLMSRDEFMLRYF
jgi:DNA ligase (NAD+)